MPKRPANIPALSRRERQVMDILFRREEATAAEVMADLPDPPSYSSVRSILTILIEKGHVVYREEGLRYVYLPATKAKHFREEALRHVISTFFNGSTAETITAVLRMSDAKLSEREVAELQERIRKARAREDGGGQ
ncbi:MAG TPA: BlaI/MecI/CopY family transcriptional regulator [Gemmatimonadaceae bacterium]|jgi:predicted transcriptional regulator